MFIPEYRSAGRQRYCGRPECRKASRRESQRKWVQKAGNSAYHAGEAPADRVKAWRAAHPGYWRRRSNAVEKTVRTRTELSSLLAPFALQDPCRALQDSWNPHVTALIGLIAWVRGTALQNVIADDLHDIMFAGRAILNDLRADAKK